MPHLRPTGEKRQYRDLVLAQLHDQVYPMEFYVYHKDEYIATLYYSESNQKWCVNEGAYQPFNMFKDLQSALKKLEQIAGKARQRSAKTEAAKKELKELTERL